METDQQLVENFLKEFVERLTASCGADIDFVLLFGSSARGEWKRGVSDVDLVIQLKAGEKKKEISDFAEKIFWQLDDKYDTKFKDVCSIKNNDAVDAALKEVRLYVPFEVFVPGDIDWRKAEIKRSDLYLGANLVASQGTLFRKMKSEGKILFGRDIRQEINPKASFWEKWKALFVPFYLSLASLVLSPFFPKKSLKMAQKSALYSCEAVLFFLDLPLGGTTKVVVEELSREFENKIHAKYSLLHLLEMDILLNLDWKRIVDFEFIKQALHLKYSWETASGKFSRIQAVGFCLRSLLFVTRMNWYAIWRVKKM